MSCRGCNDKVSEPTKFTGSPLDDVVTLIRQKCSKCTFKHLAYAYVALTEVNHGYPEHIALAETHLIKVGLPLGTSAEALKECLDHKARAVGHLAHALEECPKRSVTKAIRKAYTAILDGDDKVDILDILEKLHDATLN